MTDQPTDRPTDKAGCRVACTRLKRQKRSKNTKGYGRRRHDTNNVIPLVDYDDKVERVVRREDEMRRKKTGLWTWRRCDANRRRWKGPKRRRRNADRGNITAVEEGN